MTQFTERDFIESLTLSEIIERLETMQTDCITDLEFLDTIEKECIQRNLISHINNALASLKAAKFNKSNFKNIGE